MKSEYKVQDEEYPKEFCAYCTECSSYNEDKQYWCSKHKREVDGYNGLCKDFDNFI